MKELMKKISQLANEELERANGKFPPFHSAHEGHAVLLEEVEEAAEEMTEIKARMGYIWEGIKADDSDEVAIGITEVHNSAVMLAAKSIQVVAMARKFVDMLKGEGQRDE